MSQASARIVSGLAAVVAMDEGRLIGASGHLPWHLPEDLRWFKRLTTGSAVLMGRRTFESIGKPLPGRTNLVLTRQPATLPPGVEGLASVEEAVERLLRESDPAYVIGGAEVYAALLPFCERVFLTRVNGRFAGDAYLPPFEADFPVREEIFRTPDFTITRLSRSVCRP